MNSSEKRTDLTPSSTTSTLLNFLNSEFFGLWRDRNDIDDSVEFARELRSQGWKRPA